jgi:hypothetical protein
MTMASDNSGLLTSFGVGAISVVGAVSKSTQWYDPKTGRTSWPMLISGIAMCLIMAAVVRAVGVHYSVEPWAQVGVSGLFCYVGPDPILRGLASMALKRFGVEGNDNANHGKGP